MKTTEKNKRNNKKRKRKYVIVPFRYVLASLITVAEVLAMIGIVIALCYEVRYFYVLAVLTEIYCVVKIIASDDNPDYKVPWLLFVLILPVVGFMLYFIFSSRKLKKKYVKRFEEIKNKAYVKCDDAEFNALLPDVTAYRQAKMLCKTSGSKLFLGGKTKYFCSGEEFYQSLLDDLKRAEKFIYVEFFIIEDGKFWQSVLDVLTEKASKGVEVKVVYDDVGCMTRLPGGYVKTLRRMGVEATEFSKIRGSADSTFNNRSHRKMVIIDGLVGYTGGINIADEYINEVELFGHWKDVGIRMEGECVWEMTRLFTEDYWINVKTPPEIPGYLYPSADFEQSDGFIIPFGDGPKPIYDRRVSKGAIQNILASATDYVYITTPYLIIDNDLCQDIENTALRGVRVKIIVPGKADKKIVNEMTKSFYKRLMDAGVEIYEYRPGFIHAKTYLCDDKFAMVGTVNLDYRSLVHHFENAVWMYNCKCIGDIKSDFERTLDSCELVPTSRLKMSVLRRIFRSLVRIFAPLM